MIRLEYRGVGRYFGPTGGLRKKPGVQAIEDVKVAVEDGEVVSLIGPSGCGKSTLLNLGAGLDRPTSGEVLVDGKKVDGPNEHVAFMLQKDLLLPWRTIRKNVEFGQEIRGLSPAERKQRAEHFLALYHLDGFSNHYPHELSGGMRQRAALARTMMMDPDVLLLDEPFSALDAQTKMVLQQDLARTLHEQKKTAFLITHDLVEALVLSDRVLVMSKRPGTIIKSIKVDLPDRHDPMNRRYSEKIGPMQAELMKLLHIGEEPELV